jgi:F0F1-type ATP synthase membrane subunit b/b'
LVIKNINKNSFYGRSSQMNNAKKLIKMLEKHYKKQIQNNFDSLWNKAEKQYLQKFSKNINSLASRYSKQGQGIFDLYLLSLQNAADAAGVSTSNTNKDF